MVIVPTHSGTVTTETAATLVTLSALVASRGGKFSLDFYSGALLSQVRNAMVSDFLHSGADALMMLDADQGLDVTALRRLIDLRKPVVGCLYPRRQHEWSRLSPRDGLTLSEAQAQLTRFVGELVSARTDEIEIEVVDGYARAVTVGTGALVLRREAIDRLRVRFPELEGQGFDAQMFTGPRFAHNWGFFNTLTAAEAGANLSEDFSFCRRWREGCGGEIWADISSRTEHVGRHVIAGSYLDTLRTLHGAGATFRPTDAAE